MDKETNTIVDTIGPRAGYIEEKEQFHEPERLGCDVAQGFCFSRPVTAEVAERL